MKHLPYLDGWRGLAIAFLLLGHFFPLPGLNFGRIGVNFFFVLSGLLMAQLLFVEQVPLKRFYQRRIARIFPAVYAFLAIITLIWLALGRTVDWEEAWRAALFVNNYLPGDADMPFGHIWSLSVEEHSYVVLSLAALLVARTRVRGDHATFILALACILVTAGYCLSARHSALYFALLNAMKLPGYLSARILTPEMIVLVAWSMPLIPMGVWLGKMLDKHIDMVTFETIILIFLGITGVALLLK